MFDYQIKNQYFAQTARGLEAIASTELHELGAFECKEGIRGVHFKASKEVLYKINYCARLISRILAPLVQFHCPSDQVLYKRAYEIDWASIFSIKRTFAIFSNVSNSNIKHSQFASQRLKDAIVDFFYKKYGKRPSVNLEKADVSINLNIQKNRARISFDTSGGSLHRRGYRKVSGFAPLQETLAAAIIRLSEWSREGSDIKPLMDPMCGSGTLLSEALMTYCRIPSAFKRKRFGFFHLPDFDINTWNHVVISCKREIRECPPGLIRGSDISAAAVKASIQNLSEIPGGSRVAVTRLNYQDIEKAKDHFIITNPPYGNRMGEEEQLKILFKELGDFLKHRCTGSTAFILVGSKELSKVIGLRISQRIPLFNGPTEVRLVKIDLY
jgi:putative N6-adenine-specific DNA methylase